MNHWTDECTKSNDTAKSKDKTKDKMKKIKFANAYSSISLPLDDDSDASSTDQTIIQNMLMLCGANRYMEKFLISQYSRLSLTVSSSAITTSESSILVPTF